MSQFDIYEKIEAMGKMRLSKEEFIVKAREVHGEKYDYSKVEYYGITKPVTIICPIHGEFKQEPRYHLQGQGCKKCYGNCRCTTEEFIEKARIVHGSKYDYSKVEYVNNRTKVCIICPEHGEFWQTPDSHINQRQGCPICRRIKAKASIRKVQGLTDEEFIAKAKSVHGDKYDYSKSIYENNDAKVCIICPEHGEFWQSPHHHLNGSGCPECGRNDLTEMKLYENIRKKFPDAIHTYKPAFLNTKGKPQSLDIFIPSKNVAIEYQGRQHFVAVSRYGGKDEFIKTLERDERKYLLCKENGIAILYVSFEKEAPKSYLGAIYKTEEALMHDLVRI